MQQVNNDEILRQHGIEDPGEVFYNLSVPELYEKFVDRVEGMIGQDGTLVTRTGKHTGRSPSDRYIIKDSITEDKINWGKVNQPISPEIFDSIHRKLLDFMSGKELFVRDVFICAHHDYRTPVRVITEFAWHSVFAHNMFIRPEPDEIPHKSLGFTVISVPSFTIDPKEHGTNSSTFILLNFEKRLALIGGTHYAGEIKKSVFTALNFLLPDRGVFPMHCSANVGTDGDVALFFGLSGTGKTTLSADPDRDLIGDDEHGWHEGGVFNFEGGCYAKVIRLSPENEPEIYRASLEFGTVLENVVIDPESRRIDFDDDTVTENTRGAYPIHHLPRIVSEGIGDVPATIFMLTYDAFGVLPPIAKLTPQQAMFYFTLGYTAKVAGTEKGVNEPEATFSSCFGAPFLPRVPFFYSEMLKKRLEESGAGVWLVNTGIVGGPYGVGKRMPLPETRALVKAALTGRLDKVDFKEIPVFKLRVPKSCPGVEEKLLDPRGNWDDPEAYDQKANELAGRFDKEYEKQKVKFLAD